MASNELTEFQKQKKYTSMMGLCRVCGDKAQYFYYGSLVCLSCKTFFRRYASYTEYPHRCYFDQQCVITPKTRKTCSACRYAKCLAVGMNSMLIRKKDLSVMNTAKSKRITSVVQLPTLNLLHADNSTLSRINWTSLSNVIHAFDSFVSITQTRGTIEYLSSQPINMEPLFSMFATFYVSTESFIRSSADFQILTIDEKCSLFQRNLHGVLHLCATLILQLSGMFECSAKENLILTAYGHDIFLETKRIALQLDYDLTIVKLFLFILAFSSNCYTVDRQGSVENDRFLYGTYRIFGSQNVYVEALWKYMIYRYDYYDASRRFARLIKHMLDLLRISESAQQTNEVHQNFVDEISTVTEKSLIIHDNEDVPLWGKT